MAEVDQLVEFVFQKDPTLVKDLESHRNNDSHKLSRRLDVILKYTKSHLDVNKWTNEQVHYLIEVLVSSYIDAADSIKLSRLVEKLWQPFVPSYGEYIILCLEQKVIQLFLTSDWTDYQLIAKVSVLLEQNKQVQAIFCKHFDKVSLLLSDQLSSLLKFSPLVLNTEQTNQLHAAVKICLQLFQVCPTEVNTYIWSDSVESSTTRDTLHGIVEHVVHILQTQGYHTDCVMLCGTAIGLMFNCCPDPSLVVRSYRSLLHHILMSDARFQVASLKANQENCNHHEVIKSRLNVCTKNTMGPLSILRGIMSCGSPEILFIDFTDPDKNVPFFYELFKYISVLCEGDLTVHYHAFLILHIWYTRLDKMLSLFESPLVNANCTSKLESPVSSTLESSTTTTNFNSILESTWILVMMNWDSPVEDVPETMVEIFTSMMSVWYRNKEALQDFPDKILKNLLSTPWYVKGKYRVLASILKYVDINAVFGDTCEVQHQLLHCLTTNHFASSATNVYKAFLQKMQGEDSAITDWKSSWLPTLMEGLVSNDSLLRYNTSLHWIPVTFRYLPGASAVMQEYLSSAMADPTFTSEQSTRLLHAWIIVAKSIRLYTGVSDLEHVYVREALYHADEDIRSDAMSLVCLTLKKSECITPTEVRLLKEYLPYNIKIDSAPFRQHLGSDLRKLLVRLRDSCVTLLKYPADNKEKLDCALQFVDWLHNLCTSYLLPGASYQRRKGSLDLLHIMYESLIYCPESKQRKGFVPEIASKLTDFAKQHGLWNFFSTYNLQSLVICLLDGADEIQSLAYNLLMRYYDFTISDDVQSQQRLCCHLLAESLRLCNSPKGHEGQSGAILCKLVYNKFIIEYGLNLTFQMNSATSKYDVKVNQETGNVSSVQFLTTLLSEIQQQLTQAETDLVKASKQYPIHGMVSAFTQCYTDCVEIWKMSSAELLLVSEQFVELCQNIIRKMLSIMSGVAGQEACPSFAEIGIALENLLLEDQTYNTSTSISPEYQYMLSWCWNNIKECCISLGEVTYVSILSGRPLSLDTLQKNSSTFLTVLTKCRHKGVIEGCRSAYVRFCSALFHSNQSDIYSIPSQTLDQMLTNLKCRGISSSVTRRSAGLPIVIQAVLVSEKSLKKTVLLNQALTSLFDICELPLDADLGLTDLPQVHGLNILGALFSDASLSGSLIGHTSRAVILVIQQFASPSWAIRNAATRYFSTLVTRIFGQKKSSNGMSCNSVTYQELLSYYPDLPPFLLGVLQESSALDVRDISHIHPGLFPTLTLLSCLKPMDTNCEDVNRHLKNIFDLIWPFTQSPVYQLRHLVAAALVAMVTKEDVMSYMTSYLTDHMTSLKSSACVSYNGLHGYLLFVAKMVDRLERKEDVLYVWEVLSHELWLLSMVNNGIVSSVYVNILGRLLETKHVTLSPNMENVLLGSPQSKTQVIGDSILCISVVELLFAVYTRDHLSTLVDRLLAIRNTELRKSCLEKLQTTLEKVCDVSEVKDELMTVLCKHVCSESNQQILCSILSVITHSGVVSTNSLQYLHKWYTDDGHQIEKCSDYAKITMLPVKALLIKSTLITEETDLRSFCESVNTFSQSVNESKRHVAVQCLQIVGGHLLQLACSKSQPEWLLSILDACLRLIQDDDTDIRYNTCTFISNLTWNNKPLQFSCCHSNVCYEMFLHYLADEFSQSELCFEFLLKQLSVINLQSLMASRASALYQQLFDQEDNSFFAERIYNIYDIHSCLKCMLKTCQEDKETRSKFQEKAEILASVLVKDMNYLMSLFDTMETDSVITMLCDNTILGSVCSFLLFCDIVAMATENSSVRECLLTIIKRDELLPSVRHKLRLLYRNKMLQADVGPDVDLWNYYHH